MKRKIIVFSCCLLQCIILSGQYVVQSQTELSQLEQLPLEKIYMHYNTSVLLPGEYVYYSVYCINTQTNKLSNISRIAYLELIGENHTVYLKQKVRLEQGRGQGDFFIPVDIPSGNYKLIGYTQWMRNASQQQMFQDDIAIINPYRTDQDAILEDENDSEMNLNNNAVISPLNDSGSSKRKDDGTLVLLTDKEYYGPREKIALTPRNFKGPLGYGSYSISVRKMDKLANNRPLDAVDYSNIYLGVDKTIEKSVNDSIYLPEQRGELFFGKVTTKEGDVPVVDVTVVISIPGKDFQIRSAITDKDGNFYTYIRKEYDTNTILAQVVTENPEAYTIKFLKEKKLNFERIQFGDYTISKEMKDEILQRSIHNQIENGYYTVKPDSIVSIGVKDPYDGGVPEVFVLSDYTRFNTLRETLVEVIENVWVKKLANGNYTFWVKEDNASYDESYAGDPPLVLVDGVFIPNHDKLLDFNARTIEKISILRDPLVMGSKKYHGMVVIQTINGDYLQNEITPTIAKQTMELPAPKKNYFRQDYSESNKVNFERIPDFRYQLLWEPEITISNEQIDLEFYTSDVPGEYGIVLEGFTTYGKPISVKKTIMVE